MVKTIGVTAGLTSLLNGSADFVMADLYDFTLNGGAHLRYSGGPVAITTPGGGAAPAATWALGPTFTRGRISTKLGIEVATFDITIESSAPIVANVIAATAAGNAVLQFPALPAGLELGMGVRDATHPTVIPSTATVLSISGNNVTLSQNATGAGVSAGDQIAFTKDTVNGVPWTQYVLGLGLDSATLVLYRAFMPAWGAAVTGTLIMFSGRVTSVKDVGDTSMTMTVSSWLVLTNVNMGPDVFQAPCLNALYDASCTLSKAAFTLTTGAVTGGVSTTGFQSTFAPSATPADDYYTQGQITFTSGPNNGLSRAVKKFLNASGAFTLVVPLPVAPGIGDTFSASAGCDLSMATCKNKFNNLINFRGTPFVPPPITGFQAVG